MSFIVDPAIVGVMNGWNTYITGNAIITMFFVLLFFLTIGMVFRIDFSLILVFMIPLAFISLAYGYGTGAFGIIILAVGLIVGFMFLWLKR